ncbi:winged helix DNA-binding domain-containing protein [Streptomyces triticagri]|uniref:Winged helix DNA-binding domain-containing protein n=1 Tax=Streptomyces triticagri TaxID=2293568 RepID=A0A372M647_9ACTN|nr:winged helix DNA-binding domain-containing protein [Streptomyces triticagri]RFU86080.1 winged helix DNA-binding domain-containing protein [Streptomyces triticagri]
MADSGSAAGGRAPTEAPGWADVCARRLSRHFLDRPAAAGRVPDVVAAMGGAHAQVMSAAELSVGLRTEGTTRQDVRDALWEERTLVKTFGPRGTVHLLPAAELPLWTAALSAVPMPASVLDRSARLDGRQTDEVVEAIAAILREGEPLTVDELSEAVIARTGDWAADPVMPAFTGMWPRWRQALHVAAHRGALCFGPNRGRKTTYTSPDRWLPGPADGVPHPTDPERALAELVRRYLRSYGPARPRDFARWLSAPRPWATGLFASLGDELRPVAPEFATPGDDMYELADEPAYPAEPPAPTVRLLPYFDAYLVGSQPRQLIHPGRAAERALSATGQAGTTQAVTVGGEVAGLWHQKRSGRKLALTVELFGRSTRKRRAEVEAQAERVGEILEAVHTLTFGPVEAGKHL